MVQWDIQTIIDHCPQNFENYRKTIGSNGWTPKKTFNGDGPTLSKPLKNHWRQWWPKEKTLTIPSPWIIDHRCGLKALKMHFWDLSQWDEMCFEYHRVIFHWQKWVKNFSVVLQPNSKSHPSAAWCLLYKRMELEMTCTVDTFVNHHLFNWGLWQHMKQVVLNISIKLAWL